MNPKPFLVLAFLVILALASFTLMNGGCTRSSDRAGTATPQRSHTLVFFDKSLSVKTDNDIQLRQKGELKKLISHAIRVKGDRIAGYHIHANTGDQHFLHHVCMAEMKDTSQLDPISIMDEKQAYHAALTNERAKVRKLLTEAWEMSPQGQKVAQATNLWPILEVMSRFFAEAGNNAHRQAIIFSDMIHADGKGADLRRLKNRSEAEAAAREHAAFIRQSLSIKEQHLHGVQVYIGFPAGSMEASRNQVMKYYWEALFQEFGMKEPQYL